MLETWGEDGTFLFPALSFYDDKNEKVESEPRLTSRNKLAEPSYGEL